MTMGYSGVVNVVRYTKTNGHGGTYLPISAFFIRQEITRGWVVHGRGINHYGHGVGHSANSDNESTVNGAGNDVKEGRGGMREQGARNRALQLPDRQHRGKTNRQAVDFEQTSSVTAYTVDGASTFGGLNDDVDEHTRVC